MGNYASTGCNGEIHSVKIGTNGSAVFFVGILLAGYALSRRPHSPKVVKWLKPHGGWFPYKSRTQLERTVRDHYGDGVWFDLVYEAVDDKLASKDPDVLGPLVALYRHCERGDYEIEPGGARRIYSAALEVRPSLDRLEPYWLQTVDEVLDVFRRASEAGTSVFFG